MKQEEGQSAQQFLAKPRAKADHCNFQLTCSSEDCSHTSNSYAPAMVADILTVGCYDQDIQGELLARSADVQSLQDKFELMQAMESGKRARNQAKRTLGRVFWRETPSFGAKLHLSTLYPQQATKRTTTRL